MTGESLGQGRVRADIARQTHQLSHLSTSDIAASYEPEIDALTRPPRTGTSPD